MRIHGAIDECVDGAESITNAAKHTDASGVDVRLRGLPGALQIDIEDDGRGGADCDAGTGLRGLADRVEALGGSSR